ncbi:MAG: phytanoyl-CoA dioxygenase family protein, partial [Armatimonadetes bacterium]|nr:phytanoyl-CoA dioxygenase family protein [Armatimonadota bacterium]
AYPTVPVIAPAGSVVVFPASLWHGGGEHRSGGPRRAMHGYFCRPWCRPQYDNLRSAPKELLESATPFQLQLLGFYAQRAWEESWGEWRVIEAQGQRPGWEPG